MDNAWFYFDPADGKCTVNTAREIDGNWYMFGTDGKMKTGRQRNSGYWGAEHLKKIKIGSFLVFNCLKTFLFEKKTISLQQYIYILVIEKE